MTAPPTIAATSRARPAVVNAAAPVCRPGVAEVVVADESVGWTCTIVVEVMVLRVPSAMVVVLLYVDVMELELPPSVMWSEVDVVEVGVGDVELGVVCRVDAALVAGPLLLVGVVKVAVVVGGSVEVAVESSLELVVKDEEEEEEVVVAVDSSEVVVVAVSTADGPVSLLVAVVAGKGTELKIGSIWEVALLSRLTTFSTLAMVSSSSFKASAALMSVGKMPSWNLAERACRASWMEPTLILASTSWRDSRGTRVSASAAGCSSAATTVARAIRATKSTWRRLGRSMVESVDGDDG